MFSSFLIAPFGVGNRIAGLSKLYSEIFAKLLLLHEYPFCSNATGLQMQLLVALLQRSSFCCYRRAVALDVFTFADTAHYPGWHGSIRAFLDSDHRFLATTPRLRREPLKSEIVSRGLRRSNACLPFVGLPPVNCWRSRGAFFFFCLSLPSPSHPFSGCVPRGSAAWLEASRRTTAQNFKASCTPESTKAPLRCAATRRFFGR